MREASITHALSIKELPADVTTIVVPEFVRCILEKCWQEKPKSRPDMAWCQSCLTTKAWSGLFDRLSAPPAAEITSPVYKTKEDGLDIFINPELEARSQYEVKSTNVGSRYVGAPSMTRTVSDLVMTSSLCLSGFRRRCQFSLQGQCIVTPDGSEVSLHKVDAMLASGSVVVAPCFGVTY